MRVMVGVIILYDHVHPVGAFAKTSKIDVSTLIFRTLSSDFYPPEMQNCSVSGGWGGDLSVGEPFPLVSADEGVHQSAKRAAVQQRGGSPQRSEVGRNASIPMEAPTPLTIPPPPPPQVHHTTSKR